MKILCSVCSFFAIFAAVLSAEPLMLEGAYKAAVEKTEFGAIQTAQKNQFEARTEKAKAGLSPLLSLQSGYALQGAAGSGYANSFMLALNVTHLLYDGGALSALYEQAKKLERSKDYQLLASRAELYALVAACFYAVEAAEKDKKNIETIIKQTKEMIEELKKRQFIGKAKHSEVLMVQAQLSVLESDLEGAVRTINTSREEFSFITGISKNVEIDSRDSGAIEAKELEFYLAAAVKHPDILALETALEAARTETELQAAGSLPGVSLTGNFYPVRTGALSGINWDAGLALNIKLFDSGNIGFRVKEAANKEREASLNLEKKKKQTVSAVNAVYNRLKSLLEQINKLNTAVEISEKNYQEQKKDYEFSLVTNLEVLQAMNSLQSAKRSLDRFGVEAHSALAALLSSVALVPKIENKER